ncbi:MAG TPA: sigma 54-interacting transcriptional regulator, partial [Kofleriaceae bacterium]|nr:sigma 54-interacting transcriptional regulator [Kofleriaceae bacterium]
MADPEAVPDATITSTDEILETGSTQLLLLVVGDGVYATETLPNTGTVVIGRAADSDVCVDDSSISRSHAILHLDPPLRIEDLGSANGTWVREERLAPNEPREVRITEPVRLGTVTIIIQRRPSLIRTRRLRSHDYFENRVEDECARAARSGGSFALLHMILDRPATSVQGRLAAFLRAGDVVAVYAPSELEILLVDTTPAQGERALARLEQELASAEIPARVGASWFPRDGREPATLASRARDRAHGSAPDEAASDVVIADERMTALHELVARVAATDITVLLLGETGVGKEILAEMVHRKSARADKPFLRLNCAALTETLLESELFGHERGSFTGATQTKPGLFEVAEGGVLFLDEVGELQPSTQVKLLRVLDERKVLRVGALKPRSIDVRLVAATNRDLEAEVTRGNFRLDLMYRLNAMSIVVPPLRERIDEIEPLARAFLRTISAKLARTPPRLTEPALELLRRYSWPGNVRELRNVIERAVILCSNDQIDPIDLPVEKLQSTYTTERSLTAPPTTTGAIP